MGVVPLLLADQISQIRCQLEIQCVLGSHRHFVINDLRLRLVQFLMQIKGHAIGIVTVKNADSIFFRQQFHPFHASAFYVFKINQIITHFLPLHSLYHFLPSVPQSPLPL